MQRLRNLHDILLCRLGWYLVAAEIAIISAVAWLLVRALICQ